MNGELRWVRGARRRARYVGVGRPWRLYSWIHDLQGIRSLAERIALSSVGRLGRPQPVHNPVIQDAWERLTSTVPGIRSALLIYTGFYKDTLLSGAVDARLPLFVKVFGDFSGHEHEAERLRVLREIVPSSLVLASVVSEMSGVTAYELLERSGRRVPRELLEQAALELGLNAYREASRSGAVVGEGAWKRTIVTARALLTHLGIELSDAALSQLEERAPPEALAHGDFTPWNAFLTSNEKLAVVDYERVAPRAPFTDAWHLMTQPVALRGGTLDPTIVVARVSELTARDERTALGWYCAYLLQDLHLDATDWVVHGRHHPQLRQLIVSKTKLLDNALTKIR